jgi:hypothetical protein
MLKRSPHQDMPPLQGLDGLRILPRASFRFALGCNMTALQACQNVVRQTAKTEMRLFL